MLGILCLHPRIHLLSQRWSILQALSGRNDRINRVMMKTAQNAERTFLLCQNMNGKYEQLHQICSIYCRSPAEFDGVHQKLRMDAILFLQLELCLLIRSFECFLNLKFGRRKKTPLRCAYQEGRLLGLLCFINNTSLIFPGSSFKSQSLASLINDRQRQK